MGCDYYHEAVKAESDDVDESELSNEPGEFEMVVHVRDEDGALVEDERITVEVPVGGKVYMERLPERPPIWAR